MSEATSSTTRLHVSGLTPAISAQDIGAKLGSFGSVQSLEGFGAKDGNGDSRTYGYVTLQATPAQVSKCVSSLSGTTWRGAKLRLAPAKPDYAARIAKENEEASAAAVAAAGDAPPKKRKRVHGTQGREASDMTVVSVDNYETRKGWSKTPLGHLVRPMRMRPTHPLPPLAATTTAAVKEKSKQKEKSRGTRPKAVPTRARRRTIDPTKYGATHLSGALLENAVVAESLKSHKGKDKEVEEPMEQDDSMSSESESSSSSSLQSDAEPEADPMLASEDEGGDEKQEMVEEQQALASQKPAPLVRPPAADSVAETLRAEADSNRKLLDSLFTGRGDDWERLDVIDSDLEELVQKTATMSNSGPRKDIKMADDDESSNDETEDLPAQRQPPKLAAQYDNETDTDSSSDELAVPVPAHHEESTTQVQHKSLEEMFKPREEEAGFSLMADLGLDLELDDEFSLGLQPAPAPATVAPTLPAITAPILPAAAHLPLSATDEWRIDAEAPGLRPMFFPHASAMSVMPTHGFWRTETDEQIRAQWEERKGALTEDWKKRAKEAKKRGRRGGGTADAAD